MSLVQKEQFDKLIKNSSKIVITTHMGPDPDAIASASALYSYLEKVHRSKKVRILISGSRPTTDMAYIPGFDKVEWMDEIITSLGGVDLVIFLDGQNLTRFTAEPEQVNLGKIISICIDHHSGERDDFTLDLTQEDAIATCQIVADVLFADNKLLDSRIAKTLLYGILSDSGWFRYLGYRSTGSLDTVKRLVAAGKVRLELLALEMDRFGIDQFEIIKRLMGNTVFTSIPGAPGLTYSYLSKDTLVNFETNIIRSASHRYLAMVVRKIKGYPWGFVVTPKGKDVFGISFRAAPGAPDVRLVANQFNGGGHSKAAGGEYVAKKHEKIDAVEVCKKILAVIKSLKLEMTET